MTVSSTKKEPRGEHTFQYRVETEEVSGAGQRTLAGRSRIRGVTAASLVVSPQKHHRGWIVVRWGTKRSGRVNGCSARVIRRRVDGHSFSWRTTRWGFPMEGTTPCNPVTLPPLDSYVWVDFVPDDE